MPLILPSCPPYLGNKESKTKTLKEHTQKNCEETSLPLPPFWCLKHSLNPSVVSILRRVEIFEVEDQPIWPWTWHVFPL